MSLACANPKVAFTVVDSTVIDHRPTAADHECCICTESLHGGSKVVSTACGCSEVSVLHFDCLLRWVQEKGILVEADTRTRFFHCLSNAHNVALGVLELQLPFVDPQHVLESRETRGEPGGARKVNEVIRMLQNFGTGNTPPLIGDKVDEMYDRFGGERPRCDVAGWKVRRNDTWEANFGEKREDDDQSVLLGYETSSVGSHDSDDDPLFDFKKQPAADQEDDDDNDIFYTPNTFPEPLNAPPLPILHRLKRFFLFPVYKIFY